MYFSGSVIVLLLHTVQAQAHQVIFALNVGGDSHTDYNGVVHHKDNSNQGTHYVCDKHKHVRNARSQDEYLYKSIRHNFRNYDLPVMGDGDYLLILRFMQCVAIKAGERVMNVFLNEHHRVLTQLDVVQEAGTGVAVDKYIQFSICDGQLRYHYETSTIVNSIVRVLFVPVKKSVSLSAIALLKGDRRSISEDIWPEDEDAFFPPHECRSANNTAPERLKEMRPINLIQLFFNYSINLVVSSNSSSNVTLNSEL